MILFELFLIFSTIILAAKDAVSFKLKEDNPVDIPKTLKLIKWWHIDGAGLSVLFVLPFIYFAPQDWWKFLVYATLIRLSLFDLTFNKLAGLPVKFLGSTSITDKLFSKIFGKEEGIKKSIFFLLVTILLNFLVK